MIFGTISEMTETYAILAAIILLALSIFQILLIAGLPIGRFAWGGAHDVLPSRLRIASVFSIILYAIFATFILSKASVVGLIDNERAISIAMWIFTAYFFLGVFMNAISRSKAERLLMTPVAFILAILYLLVTLA